MAKPVVIEFSDTTAGGCPTQVAWGSGGPALDPQPLNNVALGIPFQTTPPRRTRHCGPIDPKATGHIKEDLQFEWFPYVTFSSLYTTGSDGCKFWYRADSPNRPLTTRPGTWPDDGPEGHHLDDATYNNPYFVTDANIYAKALYFPHNFVEDTGQYQYSLEGNFNRPLINRIYRHSMPIFMYWVYRVSTDDSSSNSFYQGFELRPELWRAILPGDDGAGLDYWLNTGSMVGRQKAFSGVSSVTGKLRYEICWWWQNQPEQEPCVAELYINGVLYSRAHMIRSESPQEYPDITYLGPMVYGEDFYCYYYEGAGYWGQYPLWWRMKLLRQKATKYRIMLKNNWELPFETEGWPA